MKDTDHGENGQVSFTVNSNKFAVNSSTSVLHTTQPLDREQQAQYQLTIQGTDGGGEFAKVGIKYTWLVWSRVKPTVGYLGGLYWLPLACNQNLRRGIWKRLQEKKWNAWFLPGIRSMRCWLERVLIIKENVDQFTKPKCYILPLMRSKVGSLTESFTVRLEILRVAFKHSFSFFF